MVDIQGLKPPRQPGSTPPASTNSQTLDSQRVKGFSFTCQHFQHDALSPLLDTPHPKNAKTNLKKAHERHTPHAAKQKGPPTTGGPFASNLL